ncbi:MAG: kynureninase [Chitinophagales bacterium]
MQSTLAYAQQLDKEDTLSHFRERFFIPQKNGKDVVYLCGNSLGLQPRTVSAYIQEELDKWQQAAVLAHHDGKNPWMYYHKLFTAPLAKLTGALESEVVCMNQLTVNLNLLLVSFYRPTATRYKVLMLNPEFPSDIYAVQQQAKFHGFNAQDAIVEVAPRLGESYIRTQDMLAAIETHKDELALVMLSAVNYYSGQLLDIETISKKCCEHKLIFGLDLAHAIGNVPLKLHEWNIDFATWCSYKYLNSGPGGVSGIFIHEYHHANMDIPRFGGWWGNSESIRFLMQKEFVPMQGAEGWQQSNAPILSMAAHMASLNIFEQAGMENLRKKSLKLTAFTAFLLNEKFKNSTQKVEIITPESPEERGCQLSIRVAENGKELFQKLMQQGFICDWREPDVIRIAPVPLYNTFTDVWNFSQALL